MICGFVQSVSFKFISCTAMDRCFSVDGDKNTIKLIFLLLWWPQNTAVFLATLEVKVLVKRKISLGGRALYGITLSKLEIFE